MPQSMQETAQIARQNGLSAVSIAREALVSDRTVRDAFAGKKRTYPASVRVIQDAVRQLVSRKLTGIDSQHLENEEVTMPEREKDAQTTGE
jgi:hypothetical protein